MGRARGSPAHRMRFADAVSGGHGTNQRVRRFIRSGSQRSGEGSRAVDAQDADPPRGNGRDLLRLRAAQGNRPAGTYRAFATVERARSLRGTFRVRLGGIFFGFILSPAGIVVGLLGLAI